MAWVGAVQPRAVGPDGVDILITRFDGSMPEASAWSKSSLAALASSNQSLLTSRSILRSSKAAA